MPVEIKELIIRAVAQKGKEDSPSIQTVGNENEAVVEDCVRQVLKILV